MTNQRAAWKGVEMSVMGVIGTVLVALVFVFTFPKVMDIPASANQTVTYGAVSTLNR